MSRNGRNGSSQVSEVCCEDGGSSSIEPGPQVGSPSETIMQSRAMERTIRNEVFTGIRSQETQHLSSTRMAPQFLTFS